LALVRTVARFRPIVEEERAENRRYANKEKSPQDIRTE
jgi:hypothetical protein